MLEKEGNFEFDQIKIVLNKQKSGKESMQVLNDNESEKEIELEYQNFSFLVSSSQKESTEGMLFSENLSLNNFTYKNIDNSYKEPINTKENKQQLTKNIEYEKTGNKIKDTRGENQLKRSNSNLTANTYDNL